LRVPSAWLDWRGFYKVDAQDLLQGAKGQDFKT